MKHSSEELKEIFEKYLFEKAFDGFPGILLEPAMQIMRTKAKRLRPVLLLTACEAFGSSAEKGVNAAAAVEIYHNFTLVHDDIIDEAALRRNVETVHHKFGVNKAILTGDAMLMQTFHLLGIANKEQHFELLSVFKRAAMEVVEGEQYDVDFEDVDEVSVDDYVEMIRLKTSVLLAASLQMGALIGGASKEDQEKIYNFGINLGLAFQIIDDFLDSYGDQETFGKKIGGDILQNKKTYLLCKAMEKSNENGKQEIRDIFNEDDPKVKIARMINVYDELSIPDDAETQMESYFEKALEYLQQVSIGEEQKTRLHQLAENIYQRSF